MFKIYRPIFFGLLTLLILSRNVSAQTVGEIFEVQSGTRSFFCRLLTDVWYAGVLTKRGDLRTFSTYAKEIKTMKKQIISASGTKKRKLQTKLKKYQSYQKIDSPICLQGPPILQTPTPTPLPTSAPGGIFDSAGNVTENGKTVLEIPSIFSANITAGKSVYLSNCVGCHIERTNRTFTDLRTNTSKPPMFFDETRLSNQALSDLTAYLNRFRY